MIEKLRLFLESVILKTIGSPSFARLMEFSIVLKWLEPKKGERICDIACGRGGLSYKISKRGCEVYGIDISRDTIKRNARIFDSCEIQFIIGDAESLPFRDCIFDKCVCNCALEHFLNDVRALKEMNRILKPGGILVLTVDSFTYPGMKKEIIKKAKKTGSVINTYTKDTLREKLEASGFEIIDMKYYLNSPLSNFFFRLIMMKYLSLLSFIVYPLCLISDKILGTEDSGIRLACKARKRT